MIKRNQYIDQLITSFKEEMLPSIAREESKAMECMVKARIEGAEKTKLPIEFELGNFFEAIWLWGTSCGVSLPSDTDYQKDFKEFCNQLMEPWPLDAFERAGLRIRHIHSSNSKMKYRYEISHA